MFIICIWFYKVDFIRAIVAQISDVTHGPLDMPLYRKQLWNLKCQTGKSLNNNVIWYVLIPFNANGDQLIHSPTNLWSRNNFVKSSNECTTTDSIKRKFKRELISLLIWQHSNCRETFIFRVLRYHI